MALLDLRRQQIVEFPEFSCKVHPGGGGESEEGAGAREEEAGSGEVAACAHCSEGMNTESGRQLDAPLTWVSGLAENFPSLIAHPRFADGASGLESFVIKPTYQGVYRHMVRYVRLVLAVGGNVFTALSALAGLGAYTSNDASGLQYILLVPSAGLAGVALALGLVLAVLSPCRPVVWMNPALAALALFLALLPQATGLGYQGAILDVPGAVLAAALLPFAMIATFSVVRELGP